MKQKKLEVKDKSKGFTLLELLVVVLIIGILTAIALPQYKLAVAKSKFATLKNKVKTLYEAEHRYYLIHNGYTFSKDNLDIDIKDNKCYIADCCSASYYDPYIQCYTYTSGIRIGYIMWLQSKKKTCIIFETNDTTNLVHRLCQAESNRNTPNECSGSSTCQYHWY